VTHMQGTGWLPIFGPTNLFWIRGVQRNEQTCEPAAAELWLARWTISLS
jgi:hypothetical protein